MHATIPVLPEGIHALFKNADFKQQIEKATGEKLSELIANLVKAGFGFLISEGLGDDKAEKAQTFFNENFVFKDPNADGGVRYYQGKFLLRTRKPGDNLNVYIRFCPDTDKLFYNPLGLGERLNPLGIVSAEALTEDEAAAIENNPDMVDLTIRFKDIKSILSLVERPDADVVQLLLENLVQITGNFGHMFKFGAIGQNAQAAIACD